MSIKLELKLDEKSTTYRVTEDNGISLFKVSKVVWGSSRSNWTIDILHTNLNEILHDGRSWGISFWENRLASFLGVKRSALIAVDGKKSIETVLKQLNKFVNEVSREGNPTW